jgi:threonine aldolase
MLGGGMRQAGVIAAAGIVALEQVHRLAEDHANARLLADSLADVPGIELNPAEVRTNIVFFRVTDPRYTWQSFVAILHARGLALAELGRGRLRAVTHSGVRTEDIVKAIEIIRGVLAEGPA